MLARRFLLPASWLVAALHGGAAWAEGPAKAPAGDGSAAPRAPVRRRVDPIRPPRLHAEFAQYGVALQAFVNLAPGATCGADVRAPLGGSNAPCILGSGAGLLIRAGRRSAGPWYVGGAYAFAKLNSSNLYRLGILQQILAEMRYLPETGMRATPYLGWGLGGIAYGNEWGIETGGGTIYGGGGFEFEVSRLAVIGAGAFYRPTFMAGWTDTAGISRPAGLAHFIGLEFQLEVRTELGRR